MKKVIILLNLVLLTFPIMMNSSWIFAAESLITLVTQKRQETPAGKFLNLVYTEAFRRLGITFAIKTVPAKRASHMSDLGRVDGELSRIYSYNEMHPNVIRVEEPHWHSGFIAVAADPSIQLDGWKSLQGTDYRVNYRRGIKGCAVNLPRVVRPEKLEKVSKASHGYRKVLSGRADIFIGAEMDTVSVLESDDFRNSGLQIVGVMESFTAHAFLHKKHKELVPELSEILKEMKQEGLFERYRNTAKLMTFFKD